MSESLEERLARIGDEAEAGEEDQTERPIPANVTVSRPNKGNRARSKVLQVRLAPTEYEVLEAAAELSGMTVSAFARQELLERVHIRTSTTESFVTVVDKFPRSPDVAYFAAGSVEPLTTMRRMADSVQSNLVQLIAMLDSFETGKSIGLLLPVPKRDDDATDAESTDTRPGLG